MPETYIISILRIGFNSLGQGGNVVPCVTLTSNVKGVLLEIELGVVGEEIIEEVDEMAGGVAGVVDLVRIVVVGEADAYGLVDAQDMPEDVPRPRVLSDSEAAVLAFDVDGSHQVEAPELAGGAGASLEPDDEGDGLVLPGERVALPEGVVDGGGGFGEVPVDILEARVGLVVQLLGRDELTVPEGSCVRNGRVHLDDCQCDDGQSGELKQIFHQVILYTQRLSDYLSDNSIEDTSPPLTQDPIIIKQQMSQNQKFSFQKQTFADRRFDQASNLHESSVREESIKNLTFRSNIKDNYEDALNFLASYKPLHGAFPVCLLQNSANFTQKIYKESTYYGELVNGKKNGWGIMVYKTQKIYEGQWENDKKKGYGVQKFPNGCIYKGIYSQGKPEGEGFFGWSNGQTYDGQWRKGERHGTGTWKGANGETYEGQWRDGKPNGSGFASSNGDNYEGQFRQSFKNGFGVEKFANGDMYRGHYINGMPAGQGNYYWADKSYFKGNFINGLREGKGIWKKGAGNCDKYDGYYKNDKKWGYGQFNWASGNFYKGDYEGDVRSGYGQMYWTNGSYYKGQWVNGVQHGQGEMFVPELGYKKAFFSNNSIVEVIQQKLASPQGRNRGKSEATSREDQLAVSKKYKSFRSKQKNHNLLKNTITDKTELHGLPLKHSIEDHKQKTATLSSKTPVQRSEKRVRVLRQFQKRKPIEFDEIQQAKQKTPFFRKQPQRNYKMQSLQVSKDKQKGQKHQITWKAKSKQRILHSSFYLYKLNNWHKQETTSTNRASPRYTSNFLEN